MRRSASLGCILATSLAALVAAARAPVWATEAWPSRNGQDTVTVYEIPRPDYDPAGVSAGTFLMHGQASAAAASDDNIFASNRHVANDYVNNTQESASFASQWVRHSVTGSFLTGQQVFAGHSTENANTYAATLSGIYDLNAQGFVELDLAAEQQPLERAAIVAISSGGGARPIYNSWIPTITLEQTFGRWTEFAQAQYNKTAYITSDAAGFSNAVPAYRNRIAYRVTGTIGAFFDAKFEQFQWNVSPEFRNSDNFTGAVGIDYDLPTIIRAEASVGWLRATYENAALSSLYTPVASINLLWNPRPLTSVSASFDRTVTGTEIFCVPNASTCQTASGLTPLAGTSRLATRDTHKTDIATIAVEHEFRSCLLGKLQFSHARDAFDFDGLVDDTYVLQGQARYLLGRGREIDFDYTYRDRHANLPSDFTFNSGPFSENVIAITLKYGI